MYLAFFNPRLVKGIDPHEPPHDYRFQHEVHHQRPHLEFVDAIEVDNTYGTAILEKGLGSGPRLGLHEVSYCAACQIPKAKPQRPHFRDHSALSFGVHRHDGEQGLARTVTEKLQLTVLVHGSQHRNRRRPLAIFPKAFAP